MLKSVETTNNLTVIYSIATLALIEIYFETYEVEYKLLQDVLLFIAHAYHYSCFGDYSMSDLSHIIQRGAQLENFLLKIFLTDFYRMHD